jgi:hypothetical protein
MKALSGLTDVASHDFAGFGEGGGDCGYGIMRAAAPSRRVRECCIGNGSQDLPPDLDRRASNC